MQKGSLLQRVFVRHTSSRQLSLEESAFYEQRIDRSVKTVQAIRRLESALGSPELF